MRRTTGLCALSLLLLGGCSLFVHPEATEPAPGGEDEPRLLRVTVAAIDSENIAPGVESPYWDLVRRGGPLVVGVNRNYPPFGLPAREGGWVGFDVELGEHLAASLGVPVEVRGITSAEAMARLNDGTIDVALAGLTRTVFRSAQVNFSEPYLTVSQAALVERRLVEGVKGTDEERRRSTMESYYDLADVPGIEIGVARWTRPHRLAVNNFPNAEIVVFETIEEASQALIAGQVQAIVHDDPYVRVWHELHPGQSGKFSALLQAVTAEPISIAIRKGDLEFLRFLDAYVGEVRQDGTVDRLYRRHFVDTVWKQDADLGGAR